MIIVGIGICGNGEASRYMRATLDEYKRLCDYVVIATNNASRAEIDLIDEYGFEHYEDNREWGKEQPNIKTDLLKYVSKYNPDWIIALDMDEVFCQEFTRKEAERLAAVGEIAYYFLIVNLYNDDKHFAHDKGIQRFWNIRYYRYLPQLGLEFLKKPLHCGLGPPIAYQYGWHAPYYVLHYGLMKQEDRIRKVERYRLYDPNSRYKSGEYYKDLERDVKVYTLDTQGLLNKLNASIDCKARALPKKLLLTLQELGIEK